MTFQSFVLRFELATSIITGERLNLDGLLAAVNFERMADVEAAHRAIPLDQRDGVWCGSSALLEGPAPVREVMIGQSMRPAIDPSPHLFKALRGTRYPSIQVARGPYRNKMTSYRAYDAKAVWFVGRGHLDRVYDMVETLPAIGTKRSHGFGEVRRVDVAEIACRDAGLIIADGSPARPIPLSCWSAWGGAPADLGYERSKPPYWSGAFELCALPRHRVLRRSEIAGLTGLETGPDPQAARP